jgi:Rrf2 family protein
MERTMTLVSQTTEYALRALVHLAAHGGCRPIRAISDAVRVPEAYLAKVMQHLLRAGLVTARRGPGGGVALARPSSAITVLDIVEAVDPIEHLARCPLGAGLPDGRLCPLHRHIEQAALSVEAAFAATVLADLVGDHGVPPCRREGT